MSSDDVNEYLRSLGGRDITAKDFRTWGGTMLAAMELRRMGPAASRRAFAQATWRHLLFGAVLGELERRLNPPEAEPEPIDAAAAASNGHGSAEHLVATGP